MNFRVKLFKKALAFIRKIRVSFFYFGIKFLYGKQIKIGKIFFSGRFVLDINADKFSIEIKNVVFRDNCKIRIRKDAELYIGEQVFFNSNCSINCMEKVEIGDNTQFGESVKIYDHNHKFNDPELLIKDQGFSVDAVKIGKNCWIGSNTVILKGVEIEDNVVIGANCVISQNIPEFSLVKNNGSLHIEKIERKNNNNNIIR